MTVEGIDRSEILIRPYKEEDHDQVISILLEGFWPVGKRLFKVNLFQRAVYLQVVLSSFALALLTVWLLIPFWQSPHWSTLQLILASMPKTAVDFVSKQDMTTVLGLQFLTPQFLTLWLIWAVFAGGFMTAFFYFKCVGGMAGSYAAQSMEDDMSDLIGYYQSDEAFPKTEFYKRHQTVMSQAEQKYKGDKTNLHKKNNSQFWVACLRSHPQVVLGCGALDDVGFHAAYLAAKTDVGAERHGQTKTTGPRALELRRMSVQTQYRRLGILGMLVDVMKEHAMHQGFDKIILSTTILQVEAIGGYKKAGFKEQRVHMEGPNFGIWFGAMDIKKNK